MTTKTTKGAEARRRLLDGIAVAERRLTIEGIPTVLVEGGEGPPLILLHGPGDHAAKWAPVLPDLIGSHRVIAPDLPGHGAAGPAGEALDRARILAWLDAVVDLARDDAPALVGQIVGGAIAARYACEHGRRLSALVLVDSLGLAPFQPAPEFAAALGAFIAEPTPAAHDRLWAHCAHDLDRLRARMGDRWEALRAYNVDLARDPGVQAALHVLMSEFGMPAIAPAQLDRIERPTTLIWGRHDEATSLEVAEAASERHGWPLEVVEGAADDPPVEQPEAFVAVLRSALATEVTA